MDVSTRHAYREILRAVNRHITRVAGNTGIRDYIRGQFRSEGLSAEASAAALVAGKEWAALVNSVHSYKALLHSYNIDIDREAELKERLRNTAERVGLRISENYTEEP